MTQNIDISPLTYIGSTLGNALYSGLTLGDVFEAVELVDQLCVGVTNEETKFSRLDEAVSARIRMREITNPKEQ